MKHTLLPVEEFKSRREKFAAQLPDQSVAIIFAGQEVTRSNDTEYLFCQNKSFYYLTGFPEPEAVLVLEKNDGEVRSTLFCLAKDPLAEVWHGRRIGFEQAKSQYGIEQTFSLDALEQQAIACIENKQVLCFCQGEMPENDQRVFDWLTAVKGKSRQGVHAPQSLLDCQSIIDELRLIKSDVEIDIMRKANEISGNAHHRAMEKTRAGMFEYQVEAELLYEFARQGARVAAYNSIVAGGNNANILHYTDNSDVLNDGELLLIDAGGELAGYAADITRTFPVSGQFSLEQKALYQLVLDAQIAAIDAIKPGVTLAALNDLCQQILTVGLVELGILAGDVEQLIDEKACKKYFIHGLGHWLGLDVHDVGDYHIVDKRQMRPFAPGMVMTIEPGLYIPEDDLSVDEKWRGIGIRIEDNVLVTDQGHENLTINTAKSVSEIEQLMQKARVEVSRSKSND